MLYRLVFVLWIVSQISGFLFASYGVLRASFADINQPRPFGEGRYGEGAYGGGLTKMEQFLVNIGTKIGLLPADRTLTITDKKRNAASAIFGVVLLGLSIVLDLWLKHLSRD